jgi:hypothetical protein
VPVARPYAVFQRLRVRALSQHLYFVVGLDENHLASFEKLFHRSRNVSYVGDVREGELTAPKAKSHRLGGVVGSWENLYRKAT